MEDAAQDSINRDILNPDPAKMRPWVDKFVTAVADEALRIENAKLRQERAEYERLLAVTRESLHSSSERLTRRLSVVEQAAKSMEASYKIQVADLVAERNEACAQEREKIADAILRQRETFGGGMLPFDNAYFPALERGSTRAEATRVGVNALLDSLAKDVRSGAL